MADFLDFDSLEMNVDEQVNGAKDHPLKAMKAGVKMAYVSGLLFACHADDNTLQKEERSFVMGVAHSLGLGKEDVDDLAETVVGQTDKIAYLKEIVATLKDRKTIMFFLCDMIKAMGADGELNENAQKLIGAVEKLAHLDGNDITLVSNYQKLLIGGSGTAGADLNFGDVTLDVEKSLLSWFAPELATAKSSDGKAKTSKTKKGKTDGGEAVKPRRSSAKGKKSAVAEGKSAVVAETKPDAKPKEPFSQALEEALRKFKRKCSDGRIYIGNVPTEKYLNAQSSMHILEQEHLLQYDETSFGGAREGCVFTETALYCKNFWGSDGWRVDWSDLIECDDAWLDGSTIHLGDARDIEVTLMEDSSQDPFCDLLNDILGKIKSGKYEFGC